jgi:iron complex transport system substrate-binding protein
VRIVSLLSSATEILFAIGAGPAVLAISHECDYPPEATHLPRATRSLIDSSQPSAAIDAQVKQRLELGDALYEIDRDLIRDLKPDLIVTQAQCDVCAVRYQDVVDFVAAERVLRSTRILALNPQSLSDVIQDILSIGASAGALDSARRFADSLATRIDRVKTPTRSSSEGPPSHPPTLKPSNLPNPTPTRSVSEGPASRPRVVCIERVDPLMTAGNWTPELIYLAGGTSCLATPGRHSAYVTWPEILAAQPDVLLIAPCGFDLKRSLHEARRLTELPDYHNLPAVQTNRTFVIDGNAYLNRSGPRLIDTVEILSHLLHPNVFASPTGPLCEHLAWSGLDAARGPQHGAAS